MATRACGEPETFRQLVAAPCTADLRSEACARAVVRGVDLHGPACLDLAIAASTAASLPPYRAYVCPRAAGRLARLCGTEDPGALGGGAPGGDATLYKPAAIGLGGLPRFGDRGLVLAEHALRFGAHLRRALLRTLDARAALVENAEQRFEEQLVRGEDHHDEHDEQDHQLDGVREDHESALGGLRDGRTARAILPAMSAPFLDATHLDAPIGYETLAELGSSPGCGGVRVVTDATDVVALTLEIAEFFMREQCGQCPPCRMETNQFVHVLKAVQAGKGPGYDAKMTKLAEFSRKKGRCSLIEMTAAPVISALRVFADDFAAAAGPGEGS